MSNIHPYYPIKIPAEETKQETKQDEYKWMFNVYDGMDHLQL